MTPPRWCLAHCPGCRRVGRRARWRRGHPPEPVGLLMWPSPSPSPWSAAWPGVVVPCSSAGCAGACTSAADTALSFVAPFAAYLPAEEIGGERRARGRDRGAAPGPARHRCCRPPHDCRADQLGSITFILGNLVFLLIGLQVKAIITAVREDDVAPRQRLPAGPGCPRRGHDRPPPGCSR